jgi:flavin reductase (DIM6/NTAB) family NADH-FMN oxidoreductase RutF
MADPSFIDAYRSAAQDIPRPVGVLACSLGSARYAITVDSFQDVSYDPPTMALSVYSGSRMAEQLEAVDTCALSILASQQKGIAQWLGEPGQPVRGLVRSQDHAEGRGRHAHDPRRGRDGGGVTSRFRPARALGGCLPSARAAVSDAQTLP